MKQNGILIRISKYIGITTRELFVVFIIASGLIVGSLYNYFFRNQHTEKALAAKDIYKKLDSIATTTNNDSITEIKLENDTLIVAQQNSERKKKIDFDGIVDINSASKSQLLQLYRVGDKTADKIIEYRTKHRFRRIEDIMNVPGIGAGTFEKIKKNIKI
jgi:competence ComEA-like helix-hairpin-helix protein